MDKIAIFVGAEDERTVPLGKGPMTRYDARGTLHGVRDGQVVSLCGQQRLRSEQGGLFAFNSLDWEDPTVSGDRCPTVCSALRCVDPTRP
jgi:hypothetical protein